MVWDNAKRVAVWDGDDITDNCGFCVQHQATWLSSMCEVNVLKI